MKSNEVWHHIEEIYCAGCGAEESATVEHTHPFWSYVHTCSKCGYTNIESEWDRVYKPAASEPRKEGE